MNPIEIIQALKREPFEPIRVCVSDGDHYDVNHPDQMMLSRSAAHIAIGGNGERPFQRIAIVSLLHITRLEPLFKRARSRSRKAS